jgi:hypothetical protein
LIRDQLATIEDEKNIFAEVKKLSAKQLAGESKEQFKERREAEKEIEEHYLGHLRLLV